MIDCGVLCYHQCMEPISFMDFQLEFRDVVLSQRAPHAGMPDPAGCSRGMFTREDFNTFTRISAIVARVLYQDPLPCLLDNLLIENKEGSREAFKALSIEDKAFLSFSVYAAHDPSSEDPEFGEHEILRDPFILLNTRIDSKNIVIKRLHEPYEKIPGFVEHVASIDAELQKPAALLVRYISKEVVRIAGRDLNKLKRAVALFPQEGFNNAVFRYVKEEFPDLIQNKGDFDRITSEDASVRIAFAEEVACRPKCGHLMKNFAYFRLPIDAITHLEGRLDAEDPDFLIDRPSGFSVRDLGSIPIKPSRYIISNLKDVIKKTTKELNYGILPQESYELGVHYTIKEVEGLIKRKLESGGDPQVLFREILGLCGNRRAQLAECAGVNSILQFGVFRNEKAYSPLIFFPQEYRDRWNQAFKVEEGGSSSWEWKSETATLILSTYFFDVPSVITHATLHDQPEFIPEIGRCFYEALVCKDESLLTGKVARFQYLFAHGMPYMRGSAAIGEWLEQVIYLIHGYGVEFNPEKCINLEALVSPQADFEKNYSSMVTLTKYEDPKKEAP